MGDKERIPVKIEEVQAGNILLYSYAMGYRTIYVMGIVVEVVNGRVRLNNEEIKDISECYGSPITDTWLASYGLERSNLPADILFVHQLQNRFEKKFKHSTCINCDLPHGWNEEGVFDYNASLGKRIWPTICQACKDNLESRYKTGKLNRTQLQLEFSTISGKLTKLLITTTPEVMEEVKKFKPARRGK